MIFSSSFLKRTLPVVAQSAIAHRKPRWVPIAKSNIYHIPKRPEVSEEERRELKRTNNDYKTQMRALRRFYHEDNMIKEKFTTEITSSGMSQKAKSEEWERLVTVNEQWNKQVALESEERRKSELAAMEEYSLQRMQARDKERQERISKASAEIRLQKAVSKTFITAKTLDEAIDGALANPVDLNYAIDLRGNQFQGESPILLKCDQKKTASA